MVDRDRRKRLKHIGLAGGILAGGGFGAWQGYEWITGWNDEMDPDATRNAIEAEIQGQEWPVDTVIVSGIRAEITHTGTTEEDADIYTAAVTAPLRTDVDYTICDNTEGRQELELADSLRDRAELLFDGMYDVAGKYAEPRRGPEEDRITEYTLQFEDDTGIVEIPLGAEDAYFVAQERKAYNEDWDDSRNRFMQVYGEAFDARCRDDG